MSRDEDTGLLRLAMARGGEPAFLAPHQLEAAQRLERLIRRAQVMQRVTMSYSPASVGTRNRSANGVETASDSAAAARQKLNQLAGRLPPDCWGVLLDVCGLGKGMQQIEVERRWPRRSAKLVLRIGLDQLADLFGLSPAAEGVQQGRARHWLPDRPRMFTKEQP
ncbi:MAG: DUF6456 domain-containing protein [Candidatus Devosia phytovorans]|uniref:DUF6456 domain-containing protein n=1 Tax=Candidatus Devosia phytovorans TaxID=3121372 RepID=A0AAJ5VQD6_9HYPH|nr:DUF6456 domain-containing protein [Devosia sp.]WEK02818.1 MAG: DUF6456 domain-containing protein [Devosia sp.]